MRAILICTTDLSPEEMQSGLARIGWWSALPQNSNEIAERKAAILNDIAATDKSLVAETLWYVIYNAESKTWGIVNSPTAGRVTVRLTHPSVDTLKSACDHFVNGVQKALGEPDRRGIDRLDFSPEVQILPAGSATVIRRGEVLTEARLHTLIEERKVEFRVARSALLLALVIFAVTIPPIEEPFKQMSPKWAGWFFGILERVGTAAVTTFTVFCFDLFQRLRRLRENTAIRWL